MVGGAGEVEGRGLGLGGWMGERVASVGYECCLALSTWLGKAFGHWFGVLMFWYTPVCWIA